MLKLISTAVVLAAISLPSQAQVRVAPFLAYGDQLGLWGLGAYAEILVNQKVSVSPNFTHYFPEDLDDTSRRTVWEVNANVNYYVITGEVGYLYGLAGVNFMHIRDRMPGLLSDEFDNDNHLGLNVGLGTQVRISDLLIPFAEGKYTAGGYSQLSLIFGVKFQLGEDMLEEDY